MSTIQCTPLEAAAGFLALHWDEPDAQERGLEIVRSLAPDTEEERTAQSTLAWYCLPNQWGDLDYYDDVLSLLNDWQQGEIHPEGPPEEKVTEFGGDVIKSTPDKDLQGRVIFLQPGHTVSGRGSGYHSPHATVEPNEQKHAKKVLLLAKDRLEARGAKVHMWDRTEGSFGVHSSRTRRLMQERCRDAELALQYHWNASAPSAHGHECIVTSKSGLHLGVCIDKRMKQRFPWSTSRDYDGVREKSSGRGTAWLKKVTPPAVFTELFFASNPEHMAKMETPEAIEGQAWVIEQGCADFLLSR